MDCDHFSTLSFPKPKEVLYEIWEKLAQQLQKGSRLKMLTDDGQKVITIASSGELKMRSHETPKYQNTTEIPVKNIGIPVKDAY